MLEHPLSSQLLVPLLSSGVAFSTSIALKRLVGAPGRFDDDGRARSLEASRAVSLPKRPFRGSYALLSFLIALRLYLLAWLQSRSQCSDIGVEAWLPALLAAYDCYWYLMGANTGEEEEDDIALDTFEVLAKNFLSSPTPSIAGAGLLSWGFKVVTRPSSSSTVICPASTWGSLVVFWQLVCLVLDAAIITLTWRILQWARSITDRFQSLGIILLQSAAFSSLFVFIQYHTSSDYAVAAAQSFNSLDFIHISGQSVVFLFILVALFTTQSTTLAAASILVFVCGAYAAGKKLSLIGTYEQLYKSQVIFGTAALGLGFIILAYRTRMRGLPRNFISFCITAWVIGSAVYCALVDPAGKHTIDKVMYSTRTEMNRWLVQDAKVSESLGVAVREYQDRHNRRKPPPNFDVWYEFATARKSPIIDHFKQIDEDLEPFWNLSPEQIKDGIAKLATSNDISIVSIKNGSVTQPSSTDDPNVDDFIQLVQPFAANLPDMELPINLLDRPRVLPSWTHVTLGHEDTLPDQTPMWSWEHQHQLGQACPPKAPSSAGAYSPTAQFCGSCVRPHTIGQFPTTADLTRDLCHQPDVLNLHGFYINNHPVRPFEELLPVFGRTKTNQYKDILIPLGRDHDHEPPSDQTVFTDKENRLFYRASVRVSSSSPPPPPTLLRGGHQERLSHLANNASESDRVTVLLSKEGNDELFQYEAVKLRDMNRALRFDVGFGDYSACAVPECDQFKAEFGMKGVDVDGAAKMASRYVMVMDTDDGPPGDMLQVLRSESVPFVASVFKVRATLPPSSTRPLPLIPFLPQTTTHRYTGVVHRAPLPLAALRPDRPALPRPPQHARLLHGRRQRRGGNSPAQRHVAASRGRARHRHPGQAMGGAGAAARGRGCVCVSAAAGVGPGGG